MSYVSLELVGPQSSFWVTVYIFTSVKPALRGILLLAAKHIPAFKANSMMYRRVKGKGTSQGQ